MVVDYVGDQAVSVPVLESVRRFSGSVIAVDTETLHINELPIMRDVVRHPGAVAVVAVRSSGGDPQILLVRQYRHPIRMECIELPAGLRDVAHETSLMCAQRELLEETGYEAGRWQKMFDSATTPGGSDERIELWWAQDFTWRGHAGSGEAEELSMSAMWVPLSEALDAVDTGRIANLTAQVGIFAAARKIGVR